MIDETEEEEDTENKYFDQDRSDNKRGGSYMDTSGEEAKPPT